MLYAVNSFHLFIKEMILLNLLVWVKKNDVEGKVFLDKVVWKHKSKLALTGCSAMRTTKPIIYINKMNWPLIFYSFNHF